MRRILALALLALTTTALAASHMEQAPPEVKKTVDAFLGKWTFDGKLTLAALPAPAPVKMTIDCATTALGNAVVCSSKGEAAGLGPMEMGVLIGYNPEEKLVHFMAITSGGEFHDHKGTWKDNTLTFEPLDYTVGGKKTTEDLSFTLSSDKAMSFKAAFTGADGSKESFEGSGTR